MGKSLKVMSLNIGNPSIDRAKKQVNWIESREEDVFVLTETKNSEGCNYIESYFSQHGYTLFTFNSNISYNVSFPKSQTRDLGVMIISRLPIKKTYSFFDEKNIYHARLLEVDIEYDKRSIHIMGVYVPSRDRSDAKINRKKTFLLETMKRVSTLKDSPCIICGDFNILEKNHIPHYNTFFDWEYDFYHDFNKYYFIDAFRHCHPDMNEYSWVGRTNDGYRYDHCFISKNYGKNIKDCFYVHESRKLSLTDHSAIVLDLEL